MNVLANLSLNQLKRNKTRTFWTVLAIMLSTALTTCVCSFVASGNAMLVSFLGENYGEYGGAYKSLLLIPAAFLGLIIFAMAVIVISNVFRVSAVERLQQFGTLKCVGATDRQITKSILYEGIFVSISGIPAGIIAGLCLTAASVGVANIFLEELNDLAHIMVNKIHFELVFVFSWRAIMISALISFLTVQISAWLPAKRASKNSAMESIRGEGEVAVENIGGKGNILIDYFIEKIFGFEGMLARKNINRSRKKFRATVTTLSIGIILFIVLGFLNAQAAKLEEMLYPESGYTMTCDYQSARMREINEKTGLWESIYAAPIDSKLGDSITKLLGEYDGGDVFGMGNDYDIYDALMPVWHVSDSMVSVYGLTGEDKMYVDGQEYYRIDAEIIVLDKKHYRDLCKKAGIAEGEAILLNHFSYNDRGYEKDIIPYASGLQEIKLFKADGSCVDIGIGGILQKGEIPDELFYPNTNPVRIILEEAVVRGYEWLSAPQDISGYMDYANAVLEKYFPRTEGADYMESGFSTRVYRTKDYVKVMNIAIVLALVFMYCFAGLLMLIGFTNVASTLGANVLMRKREFAVLKSIGMTQKSLNKMLELEGILCSLKAVVIGVPIGLLVTYLINLPIRRQFPIPYSIPFMQVLICIAAVELLIIIITKIAVVRLDGSNLAEAIRV